MKIKNPTIVSMTLLFAILIPSCSSTSGNNGTFTRSQQQKAINLINAYSKQQGIDLRYQPTTHKILNDNLTSTAKNRPFLLKHCLINDSSLASDYGQNALNSWCEESVLNAIDFSGGRVVSNPSGVSDYNEITCELKFDFNSSDLYRGQPIGTVLNTYTTAFAECLVFDGLTGAPFYTGTGDHQAEREFTVVAGGLRGTSIPNQVIFGGTNAVQKSLGRLGNAGRGVEPNFVTVEAFGYDDGIRSTREQDLKEALIAAKIAASQKAGTRIRTEETASLSYDGSAGNSTFSSQTRSLADSIIRDFTYDDLGYIDGRYTVKIKARAQLSG